MAIARDALCPRVLLYAALDTAELIRWTSAATDPLKYIVATSATHLGRNLHEQQNLSDAADPPRF